jgi:hypothetical protein
MQFDGLEAIFVNAVLVFKGNKGASDTPKPPLLKAAETLGISAAKAEQLETASVAQSGFSKLCSVAESKTCLIVAASLIFDSGAASEDCMLRLLELRRFLEIDFAALDDALRLVLGKRQTIEESTQAITTTAEPLTAGPSAPFKTITIEFAETKAGSFHGAISKAKKIGELRTFRRDNRNWFSVSVPQPRLIDVIPLANEIVLLKAKVLLLDGNEIDWNEFFRFAGCATTRKRAFRKVEYCFGKGDHHLNPWGCVWSGMGWSSHGEDWMRFGRWIHGHKNPVWEFDKAQIRELLLQRIYPARFCPHLNLQYIDAFFRAIPDRVEIYQGGDWEFQMADDADPDALHIRHTIGVGKGKYTTDISVKGVRPVSQRLLMSLIEQASK